MDTQQGDGIAEELAALRRIAELVAEGAPAEEIFAAVAAEAGRLLGADQTGVVRYDPDKAVTTVARWSAAANNQGGGYRTALGGRNVSTLVFQTGRSARVDDYSRASGPAAVVARGLGLSSGVGAPIRVEDRLWGGLVVASTGEGPFAADTEARLADFTKLAGTAIAAAHARVQLRGYAEEQAALRRVATLVARAALPEEVFAAVAEEIGRVLSADFTNINRYDADGMVTTVGLSTRTDIPPTNTVGDRFSPGGRNVTTLVFQTGQPARIDDYDDSSGVIAEAARSWGVRSAVGVPISVADRLWGSVTVGGTRKASQPADAEARLTEFTKLIGTAIANAEAQAALAASRARIVAAADEARRRIERDLHDGAQQRLVTLALQVRGLQKAAPPRDELVQQMDGLAAGLDATLNEVREIARGIHPAVLAEGGLQLALKVLARRSTVPVNLHAQFGDRLPDQVEIAAYYVVSETLTNIAKHAYASAAEVDVAAFDGVLRVCVRDDGRGGADFHGSGLVGLKDRVEALGGRIMLHSPPGEGTTLEVRLPVGRGCPPPTVSADERPASPSTRWAR